MAHGVRAATDITGFGLLGHLGNMLAASGVGAEIEFSALPLLPRAMELAAAGVLPGGTQRNLEAAADVEWPSALPAAQRYVAVDAQTSGGLLLSVPAERVEGLVEELHRSGAPAAAVIGTVREGAKLSVTP